MFFEGPSFDYVGPRVFGGQVLAQALLAGANTLTIDKPCHSLHGYFFYEVAIFVYQSSIKYAACVMDAVYQLEKSLRCNMCQPPTKNGNHTTNEQVIFSMIASFSPMEGGLDYQETMPDYPPPESLKTEQELKADYLHKIPEPLKARFMRQRHVEIRPVTPRDPVTPKPERPRQANWVRIADIGEQPVAIHQALLAFVSDYYLVSTGLMSHGLSLMTQGLQMASIDHSIHFHRPLI